MRWYNRVSSVMVGGICVLVGACADADPPSSCAPGSAGEPVISATQPRGWSSPPGYRELWRVGGTNEEEAVAVPISVSIDHQGRAAIPDFALGEVLVVEADGGWRGAVTAKGRGPGEVAMPLAAAYADDFYDADGRLWVQRDRPSTLSEWDAVYGAAGGLYDVYDAELSYLDGVLNF